MRFLIFLLLVPFRFLWLVLIFGPGTLVSPVWTIEFIYERWWLGKTTEDFERELEDFEWFEREYKKDRRKLNA
jgi:hypothetical protein